MTRINTNVSSLVAQNTLGRNNNDLQQALGRLSTGLRINSGADDPAGLIASETLRRDITAVDKAISNSEKAGQLIATADSALGQVSNLLNDIRGLVTEAANAGVLSDEQIAAQQLQVDSSLEAIDRIAASTTFQGRKILDGSLGFLLTEGAGFDTVADLQIDQANLGATGSLAINVDVAAAATKAQITNSIPTTASAQIAFDGQTFSLNTTAASGLDSVNVAVEVAAGAEATGTVSIDGHEFRITADSAQAASFDAINVDVLENATNHAARSEITFDSTIINIQADTDTTFDNTTVNVQKTSTYAAGTGVTFGDGTSTQTFDIVALNNGAAEGASTVNVVLQESATANFANYTTSNNTLTINLQEESTAISDAALLALIEGATVNGGAAASQVFDATLTADTGDLDVSTATGGPAALTGTTSLTRADVTAAFSASTNELTITLNDEAANVTAASIIAAINGTVGNNFNGAVSAVVSGPANVATANVAASTTYGTLERPSVLADYNDTTAGELTISIDALNTSVDIADIITAIDGVTEFSGTTSSSSSGTINGTTLTDADNATVLNRIDGAVASFNSTSNTLTLRFDSSDTAITNTEVIAAIDAVTEFENTSSVGTGTIDGTGITANANLATAGRVQDLVVRIGGHLGSEVFNFQAGSTFQQIANAIQLVSDATGVTATVNGSSLEFDSTKYGSNGFVDVEVISEGAGGTFKNNLSALRDEGTDIDARVNGIQANGDGNQLSINTSTLDLSITVDEGSDTDVNLTINGGGAVFQLGPDVVSNQQAQIGINSIATGKLGGVSGRLYELRSGGARALKADTTGAQRIVDESITEVVNLRGRLGAFQRTTLESNINSLQDTLVNLTQAESTIRDADFAKESAALTRAQILVQSGTSVLAIANQNPQNVLQLLG